ncbi:MAG: cytochrome c oxidase subunit 4 [Actinomycetes bacterium]
MKWTGGFFGGLTVFFLIVAAVYGFWSQELAGTTALILTAAMSGLLGFYVTFTERRLSDLPEDNLDAEVDEGAGEIGFYSPHSWWPLAVAASGAAAFLGIVFGWWLLGAGLVALGLSSVGLVFEYYRPTQP